VNERATSSPKWESSQIRLRQRTIGRSNHEVTQNDDEIRRRREGIRALAASRSAACEDFFGRRKHCAGARPRSDMNAGDRSRGLLGHIGACHRQGLRAAATLDAGLSGARFPDARSRLNASHRRGLATGRRGAGSFAAATSGCGWCGRPFGLGTARALTAAIGPAEHSAYAKRLLGAVRAGALDTRRRREEGGRNRQPDGEQKHELFSPDPHFVSIPRSS
jgi:hypothetical protein